MTNGNLTGDDRCWPCTVANSVVGLLVAWVPLAAALVEGSTVLVVGTVVWGLLVTGFTGYRLVKRGYLPLAGPIAKLTSLHERIGPGSQREANRRDE